MEFFMGIRFNANTWRTPLQLIDCWLPVNPARQPASPKTMHQALQNFVRAGWLNQAPTSSRPIKSAANTQPGAARQSATVHNSLESHRRTIAPQPPKAPSRTDARLVISGRMGDVCAELERLAALELRASR